MTFLRIVFLILLASCGASAQLMQEINEFYKKGYSASTSTGGATYRSSPASSASVSVVTLPNGATATQPNGTSVALPASTTLTYTTKTPLINQVSAIPNFNSLLGNNILLPQIEIRGITNFKTSRHFYGDIKLFTSAFAQKRSVWTSIFFPETSVYGISVSINALPLEKFAIINPNDRITKINWFCTYFNFNYLGKSLQGVAGTDTIRFTTDVAHFKLGIQLIPVKNFISIYTDINFVSPVVNRAPLLEFNPTMKRGFNNFVKIGAKFYIESADSKPLNVFVDLGAVAVGRAARTIYDTRDALIPRITLGGSVRF